MFSAAKAQFDLALAWSELAMSMFTATTMVANSGAQVQVASAAVDQLHRGWSAQPAASSNAFGGAAMQPGMFEPMQLANAAAEATMAFWSALLAPPKPVAAPLPLWSTAFTDPVRPVAPAGAAPRAYLLH